MHYINMYLIKRTCLYVVRYLRIELLLPNYGIFIHESVKLCAVTGMGRHSFESGGKCQVHERISKQEAQLLLGDRATRKHAKDS